MKFGDLPVSEAAGAILAHSHRTRGGMLRKGRVVTPEDVGELAAAGVATVRVARLEDGDLDEQEAARRVAAALAGDSGLTPGAPGTGRVNLFAPTHGLLLVDAARLTALNAVDEAITASTLASFQTVVPGQIVATVKIIPFGVAETTVAHCEALASGNGPETEALKPGDPKADGPGAEYPVAGGAEGPGRPAGGIVTVAPFTARSVVLIQTTLPHTGAALLEKGRRVTDGRLQALGAGPATHRECPHDVAAIAEQLAEARREGCDITLVLGASAITDRRDTVPEAVAAAGGTVDRLGLPVDPGNLTLLARLGDMWILGIPGSARSPREHGFDWILRRLMARIPVPAEALSRMAVGGLLKEIPGRPAPRRQASRMPARTEDPRRVAALVLAAGQSRRMGWRNKLLEPVGGEAMVARTVDAALASQADPVVVVLGHEADRVRDALSGRDLSFVENPDYASGMSTSLACGLNALPETTEGVVVCLGDMPLVGAGEIDRLLAGFAPEEGRALGVPTHRGKRGNPVLIARRLFSEALAVTGDIGARHLLGTHPDEVYEVAMESGGVLADADTPATLDALAGKTAGEASTPAAPAAQDPTASAHDSDSP